MNNAGNDTKILFSASLLDEVNEWSGGSHNKFSVGNKIATVCFFQVDSLVMMMYDVYLLT